VTVKHVYFAGTHGAGKSTLVRWVAKRYGLPTIHEVARAELTKREAELPALRVDTDLVSEYQRSVFRGQVEAERAMDGPFVSDRCVDNLAYLAQNGNGLRELWESAECRAYVESLRAPDALVFLVQPHASEVHADAHRPASDADARVILRIDGMVHLLFELAGIPYVPEACGWTRKTSASGARKLST
jgi:predicted ATPase